jgi:hypothetical protein
LDQWPTLAGQVRAALLAEQETVLAASIESLEVVAFCGCGDDFCQSFYTAPKPDGVYKPGHRNILIDAPWPGYLIVDVVKDEIVFVEVLYRSPLD